MGTEANIGSKQSKEVLYRLLKTLRGSLLLSFVALGVLLMVAAVIFNSDLTITQQDDVIAGMLGVFSISAVLGGGGFYLVLKILHRK